MNTYESRSLGDYQNIQYTTAQPTDEEIVIANEEILIQKLKKMRQDGINQLEIFSDFDQTISSFYLKNEQSLATFAMFRKSQFTSQQFKEEMTAQWNQQSVIELDYEMDPNVKIEKLKQFHEATIQTFLKEKLTKQECCRILNNSNIGIRGLFDDFFQMCKMHKIPFNIVSGGVTEAIRSILDKVELDNYKQCQVYANEMIFDDEQQLQDIKMQIYGCKSQFIKNLNLELKKNLILMGDSLSDAFMNEYITHESCIKIGLFDSSSKQEKEFNQYLKQFDIILKKDPSYNVPLQLLNFINGNTLNLDNQNSHFKNLIQKASE